MKSKKLFFVADAKSIHTAKWIDYFVAKEYEVHLATFAKVNNTKCTNIYFLTNKKSNVEGGNYHYILSIAKLANILQKVRPDIVNAHYSYSMGLIALLALKKAKIEAPLSVVCHGSDLLDTPNSFIFDKLNSYILNRCEKVFVVSDQLKDKVESFGIISDKIFTGQYGIEPLRIAYDKDIDIISNRTYNTNSRIHFLLDSLEKIKDQNLNIVFVLPTIEEKERLKLQKKYPFVQFYADIPHYILQEIVARSKIYLSATLSDGTPLSLLEALDLECIPVISNIVANRSWVLDGVNGYLFNTEKEMLQKIQEVLNTTKMQPESMKEMNKNLILEKAYYPTQMRKIEEFLL